MPFYFKHRLISSLVLFGMTVSVSTTVLAINNDKTIDAAINQGVERAVSAQKSQAEIDKLDSEIRVSEREYRGIVKEIEGLNVYTQQLDKQLVDQEKQLVNIENSIAEVTLIERQITPLMLRMIDSLKQFVNADVPFQKTERMERVKVLEEMMGRADVTVSEKYRKVMDAYQKEMDYGRTIKTYRSTITIEGKDKEVDFLRIGRIALLYQSLDEKNLGIWNNQSQSWQDLDSVYKSKFISALRIAREQAAPDLFNVPITAAVQISATAINSSLKSESK